MQGGEITRIVLYAQVWSTPIHRLAILYGLSDVGLAKICKRHNIPRPPRGYWAKLAAGQSPVKIPLPDPDDDVTITIHASTSPPEDIIGPEIQAKIEAVEKTSLLRTPKTLRNPHPLVARSLEILELCSPDKNGILVSSVEGCLDIRVSPSSLKRALRIMQALIKELESKGASFKVGEQRITIVIEGEGLRFSISEIIESEKTQPDDDQLKGYYQFGHSQFEYIRRPSGRLCLTLHDTTYLQRQSNLRKNWRDTGNKHLEDQLDSFLIALYRRAGLYREKRIREEEEERRRLERIKQRQLEEEHLAELKAQVELERAKFGKLVEDATNHFRSIQIHEFINTVEADWKSGNCRYEIEGEISSWIKWARDQANRLDPLTNGPSSIMDQNPEPDNE